MTWPFEGLIPLRYGAILIDPPWAFENYSAKGHGKAPAKHYECMSAAEIRALPVSQLAAPDCALVMWATAPMLPVAVDTMETWGFVYQSAGAWAKQSTTGNKWAFGTGYRYRSAAEFWLLGTLGQPRQRSRSVRNLIVAPIREHSRKPDQMHEDIERLWHGPYAELFARTRRPNWACWGNETGKFTP